MKNEKKGNLITILNFGLSLLGLVTGILLMLLVNSNAWIISGFFIAISGVVSTVLLLLWKTGLINNHYYEFIHFYNNRNHLVNETYIVKKVRKRSDINALKKQHNFNKNPILVNNQITGKGEHSQTKISGIIYASDEEEAKRTLHYTLFD